MTSAGMPALLRVSAIVAGVALLAGSGLLAYVSVVALRRNEGVFMPTGYVSLICLLCGIMLLRLGLRY